MMLCRTLGQLDVDIYDTNQARVAEKKVYKHTVTRTNMIPTCHVINICSTAYYFTA